MRVLWFSNCVLGNSVSDGSGSWLHAMSRLIKDSVELTNVVRASVNEVTYTSYDTLHEVLVPSFNYKDKKVVKEVVADRIQTIIKKIAPDIIHIWGTEGCWATRFAQGSIKGRVLLEIQGLMEPISDVFWGGLNPCEVRRKSICVRNIVYPSQGFHRRMSSFRNDGKGEKHIMQKAKYISTQSNWVRDQIQFCLPEACKVYNTLRPIRQEFWNADPWHLKKNDTVRIFTSMSYYDPFKGMHILVKAVSVLKRKYKNVILEIAGVRKEDLVWYRQYDGIKYLKKLALELNVWDNIEFVGRLTAPQIIKHLQDCNVFVNPSFVESFSASTAEALSLGVPTVLSYAGAMPDFSSNQDVALYYSPMDHTACAARIVQLVENNEIRKTLADNARSVIIEKCGNDNVRKVQVSIYSDIINNTL